MLTRDGIIRGRGVRKGLKRRDHEVQTINPGLLTDLDGRLSGRGTLGTTPARSVGKIDFPARNSRHHATKQNLLPSRNLVGDWYSGICLLDGVDLDTHCDLLSVRFFDRMGHGAPGSILGKEGSSTRLSGLSGLIHPGGYHRSDVDARPQFIPKMAQQEAFASRGFMLDSTSERSSGRLLRNKLVRHLPSPTPHSLIKLG
jgi:hypothetical protein